MERAMPLMRLLVREGDTRKAKRRRPHTAALDQLIERLCRLVVVRSVRILPRLRLSVFLSAQLKAKYTPLDVLPSSIPAAPSIGCSFISHSRFEHLASKA